mgnify:CR=1 FL=1
MRLVLWSNYRFSLLTTLSGGPLKTIQKSAKLANVCYDIRGPIMDRARQMEEEGQKIIKLNIGNLAVFGFDAPEEIQQDMIRNLPNSAGYSDSKGIFAARKAVMHETQKQGIKGVTLDDIYLGNGASELIVMATNGLLDNGDELLLPAPDYPLWTAAASLSGGTPVHYLCDEQSDWLPDLADLRPHAGMLRLAPDATALEFFARNAADARVRLDLRQRTAQRAANAAPGFTAPRTRAPSCSRGRRGSSRRPWSPTRSA